MNFGQPKPFPYEMYVALGAQNYRYRTMEPDMNPYLDMFVSSLDYRAPSYFAKPEQEMKRGESNLEGIADGLSLAKWTDPVGTFLSAKKGFLEASIKDLLGQIEEREHLLYSHLREIQYETLANSAKMLEVGRWQRGFHPNLDRVRSQLEKLEAGFERERRMEEVASWRDISRLKTELREVTQEWGMEKQKELLLWDTSPSAAGPDSPKTI